MASTQKKTTKKKKAPPKPEPPAYNGLARLIGGVVCLLLALCVLVSYFQVDALLLTFIAKVLKGTLGYGYFLAAPALLAVAVIQLRHQGRPVILRTTCTLLVPLLSGMLCHLLLCRTAYELGSGLLPQLWKDGQTLTCGGVVAGGLALGSEALLSKVVSVVVFVVLLVAALLGALHMTPQQAVDKMKEYRSSRWEDEEDEDDLEGFEPAAPRKAPVPEKPVKEKPAKRRVNIDIPLDGESSAMESGEKKDFFPRRSAAVRTPDEVLDRAAAAPAVPAAPAAPAASTAPAAPAVQEAAAVKEPVSEKKKKAQVQQEVESAAQEVGQAIEQELAQGEEIYRYPPITLLEENHTDNCTEVGAELRNNSRRLADALRSFGVDATAGDVVHGPSVTRYEFTLEQGVKLSKITNLSDDIALALGASGVRVAPVPNKISVVGNIVLNELDWWIASQWENMPTKQEYSCEIRPNGTINKTAIYGAFKNTTNLKEVHIVRYADDFKLFCRKRSDAEKVFIAVKLWLHDRLKLEISDEKSKIVNLKRHYSEFLGFEMKAVKKRKRYVVKSHMTEKAVSKEKAALIEQVKQIAHVQDRDDEAREIALYNSMVFGIHNYYRYATMIATDCEQIQRAVSTVMKNRLYGRLTKKGQINEVYIRKNYGDSKQIRFISSKTVAPVGYIQTKTPLFKKKKVCKYTPEGRAEIHRNLGINTSIMLEVLTILTILL